MTTIDDIFLFHEQNLVIDAGSLQRENIERSAAGVNGVLSIDLGKRSRKIKQKGQIRAASEKQLREKIDSIESFLDGKEHKLTGEELVFENIRMDSFKAGPVKISGNSLIVDYEITYTQLKV